MSSVDAAMLAAAKYTCKVCKMEAMTGETLDTFFGVGHTAKRGCRKLAKRCTVVHWTGAITTITATDLSDAYRKLGYFDGDGTHLWEDTGEVTNIDGELCVTITLS